MLSILGSIFFQKTFAEMRKSCIFAITKNKIYFLFLLFDPVVQLVRIPACHLVMNDETGSS